MRKTIPINPPSPDGKKKPESVTPKSHTTSTSDASATLPVSSTAPANMLPAASTDPLKEEVEEQLAAAFEAPVPAPKPGKLPPAEMLDVEIKDKKQLQSIYMPFLTNGGVFLPTAKEYALGDEVYLNLHLLKESRQYSAIGRVAWITPRNALNKRIQGVGIHFSLDESTGITKRKIEELLGSAVKSDKSTHTL